MNQYWNNVKNIPLSYSVVVMHIIVSIKRHVILFVLLLYLNNKQI